MIPVFLSLSGFLSYHDTVELDFSTVELACISGANGAGKSSLLDAITWALFGKARREGDALINSHDSSAEVIFDFNYEGDLYRIKRVKPRSKSTLLEFYLKDPDGSWRPLSEHTMGKTEERIRRVLRMDFETFTNASFFLQGKADQFAQQGPADRKRILGNILGLEVWDVYRQRTFDRRKKVEKDLTGVDSLLAEIDAELSQEHERRSRLKILEDSLEQLVALSNTKEKYLDSLRQQEAAVKEEQAMLEVLANQVSSIQQELQQYRVQIASLQEEHQLYQQQLKAAPEIESDYKRWMKAQEDLDRWEPVAANFRQYEGERSVFLIEIEGERSRLNETLRALTNQQSQVELLSANLPSLEVDITTSKAKIIQLNGLLSQKPVFESDLLKAQQEQADLKSENFRLKNDMDEIKGRMDQLKEVVGAVCPLCGQPLSPEDRQKLITSLEADGKQKGDQYRGNQKRLLSCDELVSSLKEKLAATQPVDAILRQEQRQSDQLEAQRIVVIESQQEWQTKRLPELEKITQTLQIEDYAPGARARLAKIDESLKILGYDTASHETARQAEMDGRTSQELWVMLEKARSALGPVERNLKNLKEKLKSRENEAGKIQTTYDQAQARFQQDAAIIPTIRQAESELIDVREKTNRLRMEVGGARQAVDVLVDLRVRRENLNTQRSVFNRSIAHLKTLELSFSKDGIPALLIEQALPEIEMQANEILDRLTAGGMSVRFSTQRDYKDRNREDKKETLDILISDSVGVREYELYSGGEAFRVNFAIRLALSRVLAQRSGARLQTLVIDEGFGSQDAEGRQRLVEAINLVRSDFAKVLIITHLEELKDVFPARIEVEKTAQGSSVKVIT